MPRGQEKKEAAVATKPQNPFAALADSDSSDSEGPSGPVAPAGKAVEVPTSPSMRTWPTPSEKNVFGSPFSRKRWNKPRFKEDTEGWVSIRWNQPQFQDEPAPAPLSVLYQPRTPPFYPIMGDPNAETKVSEDDSPLYSACTPPLMELDGPQQVTNVVLEETITPSGPVGEQLTALAWAERVKKSLEKAEAARAANAAKGKPTDGKADEDFKEALGRLSFFRRGISETQ